MYHFSFSKIGVSILVLISLMISLYLMSFDVKAQENNKQLNLESLTKAFVLEGYNFYPMSATFSGVSEFNNKYTPPNTAKNKKLKLNYYKKYQRLLDELNKGALNEDEKITYDLLQYNINLSIDRLSYPEFLLTINQISGAHIHFAMLGSGSSGQPFQSEKDYRNFMQRSVGFSKWIDSIIISMAEAAKTGHTIPKYIVEEVITQLETHIVSDVKASIFYQPLNQLPEGLSSEKQQVLVKEYSDNIQHIILPAYRSLYEFLKDEYIDIARTSIGISSEADSNAWYEFYIKEHVTESFNAEDIHALGKEIVTSNLRQLTNIKSQLGFDGTLTEFFTYLKTNETFYFKSKEALINAYRHMSEKSNKSISTLFDVASEYQYQIAAVPDFAAAQAPRATYRPPAPDGSRSAIFYINAHDLKSQPKYLVEAVSLHEASPGHHLQNIIQLQNPSLSDYRKSLSFTAFDEGWGLYAESLGTELGFYAEPQGLLGRILADQQRALRLVVDTGIHALGWTYEQAKNYMMVNSPLSESEIKSEIERYITQPGQALAYKMGEKKIVELRDLAQQTLGTSFDVRKFHQEVLRYGSIPMQLLEQQVKQWIINEQVAKGIKLSLAADSQTSLNGHQLALVIQSVNLVTRQVKKLLSEFPEEVTVEILLVDKDLDRVGGVTGIAQTPTRVNIEIAKSFKLGIDTAIREGLKATLYHEFHHLATGWTIQGNKFGPGIAIASVNEGLASVFAEEYSQVQEEWTNYPDGVEQWVQEILALAPDASYATWMMGTHPDGRQNIGYRAGKYITHKAMERSGLSIIELSKLSPYEILNLSGSIQTHGPSLEKLGDFYAKTKQTKKAIKYYEAAIRATAEDNEGLISKYQRKVHLLLNPVVLSDKYLAKLAGDYLSDGLELTVTFSTDTNKLKILLPGKPPFNLHPESKNLFFIHEADVTFEFYLQETVPRLRIDMFGRLMELVKKE